MIDLETALYIHDKSTSEFSDGQGTRDEGALLAALSRPFMAFDQQDLYPTPAEKAAAIFESLIINHPFIDGNKRTAYVLLRSTLLLFDFDVLAFENEKYEFTIAASTGQFVSMK
jgi:death-on-curing protein